MELDDRGVLITGASRGIGEAMAKAFAAAGARVVVLARDAARLNDVAAAVKGTAIVADLTDRDVVDGLWDRVEGEAGPIDVLVNNAGIDLCGPFVRHSPSELETVVRLNLITPMELARQALPAMLGRGRGHIVNVSSLAGVGAFPGLAPYAATKAGLSQFTAGLRADLRRTRIKTTLVELGPVRTDMLDSVYSYEPTRRAFARAMRIGVLAAVDRDPVAADVVAAVQRGRRHVRHPKRAMLFPLLAEAPRRITEVLITGVPTENV